MESAKNKKILLQIAIINEGDLELILDETTEVEYRAIKDLIRDFLSDNVKMSDYSNKIAKN